MTKEEKMRRWWKESPNKQADDTISFVEALERQVDAAKLIRDACVESIDSRNKLIKSIHTDLMMRSEYRENEDNIVNIGTTLWMRINDIVDGMKK